MTAQTERNARRLANASLHALGTRYHESIPVADVDSVLRTVGFCSLAEGIYCGRDGHVREQVGARTWLTMTWHKMESGRYEIVAYVN